MSEMHEGAIEDRLAIRELLEASTAGVMRKDSALWGATWAEDGIWHLPSMTEPARGKARIVAVFKEKMAFVDFMSMSATPGALMFDGDRAHGQAYCREEIYTSAGSWKYIVGCYNDAYIRTGGKWLFESRRYEIIGQS